MADWTTRSEATFDGQFKRIGHERQLRVSAAIDVLTASVDPTVLGKYKNHAGAFAYEIGRSDRPLYRLDRPRNEIVLLRVCDHKSVYGRG